jgi:Fe-S cluster biogenesis protein NfuA
MTRIQASMARMEECPDPAARELLQDCLQDVLALYGHGLERILDVLRSPEPEQRPPVDRLLEDSLIRALLLIHGLHPDSLETRVRVALDKVRPYLQTHGGNVELVGLEQDVATLRLLGTCDGCPSSILTMKGAIGRALEETCPDLAGFELEETKPAPCA